MSTERTEVKVYREYLICDDCAERMIWDGFELLSNPPQYNHQCPKCGKMEQTRGKCYPRLFYVDQEAK
jgi:hypothetical protein